MPFSNKFEKYSKATADDRGGILLGGVELGSGFILTNTTSLSKFLVTLCLIRLDESRLCSKPPWGGVLHRRNEFRDILSTKDVGGGNLINFGQKPFGLQKLAEPQRV
jgi:hypothetical protein